MAIGSIDHLAQNTHSLEAKVFAISDFVPSSSRGCNGNDISHWDNIVDEWYDQIGAEGHTKDGQFTDGSMTIQRFCDPDWTAGFNDASFIDDADTTP